MKVLAVDDEYLALEGCMNAVRKARPDARIEGYDNADDAIKAMKTLEPDVAFLDVEMRGENGVVLARKLQEINDRINIIFVTGYFEYMKDAFDIYASGYILKPVTEKKVADALDHLRYPVEEKNEKIKVVTFGNFEAFGNDGLPLDFSYSKTRELLAVLIDANGAMRTFDQIMNMLWMDEDDAGSHGSYLRNMFADMQRVLAANGCEEAIIRRRGEAGVDKNFFDCDYFDFLAGKQKETGFSGEYMSQYSWGELTLGRLVQMEWDM